MAVSKMFAVLFVAFYAVPMTCTAVNSRMPELGRADVMFSWVTVEFEWPSEDMKEEYLHDGRYNRHHNLISGIRTYRGQIYVTVPRLRYTTGVPSTLNIVVQKGPWSVLRPFPDWESQELGNCSALQSAMSMEVDPISGYMYVIDPGRSGIFGKNESQPRPFICPPKLVVYDLKNGRLIRSHNFPEHLVSHKTNFLNDIVIDRGSPLSSTAKWVYITDAADAKLIVFNLKTNKTHIIQHYSMEANLGKGSNITVNGKTYKLVTPIDGLAMSADFQYLYYCALGSENLFRVPTRVVRNKDADFGREVRFVGAKISQTGGMTYATNNLYYGALNRNAVYRWEVSKDMKSQEVHEGNVMMMTQREIVRDDKFLQWPDSLTVDEYGYLWFTACRAQLFLFGGMDFYGKQGFNFSIWRIKISEASYLAPRYS